MSSFHQEIEEFVSAHLPEQPKTVSQDKIIHDSLLGTLRIRRHEVALLDTPLMQRLRRIHQTSFAYLTYPSAEHNRFEHSLGCLCLAEQFVSELQRKDTLNGTSLMDGVGDNIRAAALLHDVGHGPFSHCSEEVYGSFAQIEELVRDGADYDSVKPHEVLSCLIVRSEAFRHFVGQVNSAYGRSLDADRMAEAISGRSPLERQFESDILNGSFDVDKIEYVVRDGRLMGLPTAVDLSRLLTALEVTTDISTGKRQLTIGLNGEITLEQLVFAKMVLFTSVYQHHKARACDCLFKGIFEYARKHGVTFDERKMDSPADFLWWTDNDLSGYGQRVKRDHPVLHDLMHGLSYRRLPKRALVLAPSFWQGGARTDDFLELRRNHKEHRETMRTIAHDIHERAGVGCDASQVWVDLPKSPAFKEGDETIVREPGGSVFPLNDFFGVDQWGEHFDQHKWRGHVFGPEEHIQEISAAARAILLEQYDIQVKPISWEICHLTM